MQNKELYKTSLVGKITKIEIQEETARIYFGDDKKIVLESYHDQDCCEHVYADFSVLKLYEKELIGLEMRDLIIKGVEDMGFLLCLAVQKIFIPCYNMQNGYYSDNLSIRIIESQDQMAKVVTINLNGFIENQID